ncbi:MAG: hypothetical protein MUC87_02600 [Bacteroidia bacterium]|jgi:hypothetical protein|nr:hypothetical protein [Bacteroidia bacterium]
MMKYLCSAFFFIAACASDTAPRQPDKPTRVFSYYLRTAFGDSIPQEAQMYMLVPQNGCKGCMVRQLGTLAESLRTENSLPVQLILARKISGTDSLRPFIQQSRYDTHALMDRIDLPVAGVTLIKTSRGKVVSVEPMRDK